MPRVFECGLSVACIQSLEILKKGNLRSIFTACNVSMMAHMKYLLSQFGHMAGLCFIAAGLCVIAAA